MTGVNIIIKFQVTNVKNHAKKIYMCRICSVYFIITAVAVGISFEQNNKITLVLTNQYQ